MSQLTAGKEKIPVIAQVRQMGSMFWIANGSEAFERLAFFGVRAVLPLYMFGNDSVLHLSMTEKGIIFGVWALIQCLLPMVSGGYTEAYGYRKSLVIAFSLNTLGYLLMANIVTLAGTSHLGRFWLMMAAACLVGTGTAIFKPPVQGMVAKALNEGNSSLGFGIFYWIVNIGGALAPTIAAAIRGTAENPTWANVFYGAAIVSVINLLYCLVLFVEPKKDEAKAGQNPITVFTKTMKQLWQDQSMFRFLLVISGFWLMFMQLWDLLPNFINEWVDTRDVGGALTFLIGATQVFADRGRRSQTGDDDQHRLVHDHYPRAARDLVLGTLFDALLVAARHGDRHDRFRRRRPRSHRLPGFPVHLCLRRGRDYLQPKILRICRNVRPA